MRIFALVLLVVLLLLQVRLWISDDGLREMRRLEVSVAEQKRENAALKARNDQLAAEVKDLKEGMAAVEERARSDLGMVGASETFYQIVKPEPLAPDSSQPSVEPARPSQQPASTPRKGNRPAGLMTRQAAVNEPIQ